MPEKKLTKKDVVKILPKKVAKFATVSLNKILGNPLGVIALLSMMAAYASSSKSSDEFKRIYYRAVMDGTIGTLIGVAIVNAVFRLLVWSSYKKGNISKKRYETSVKHLSSVLKAMFAGLTVASVLTTPGQLKDVFTLYLKKLAQAKQMPEAALKFVKAINPKKPDLAGILKAARAYKVKAPWLSRLGDLLRKLKKDSAAARKYINLYSKS